MCFNSKAIWSKFYWAGSSHSTHSLTWRRKPLKCLLFHAYSGAQDFFCSKLPLSLELYYFKREWLNSRIWKLKHTKTLEKWTIFSCAEPNRCRKYWAYLCLSTQKHGSSGNPVDSEIRYRSVYKCTNTFDAALFTGLVTKSSFFPLAFCKISLICLEC